jgi:SAM-dependent methyltransferase
MIDKITSSMKFLRAHLSGASFFAMDALERFVGGRDDLVPPRRKISSVVSPKNFKEIGSILLEQMVDLGQLKSDERVLEVGCGIGRAAIPLTKYLNNQGEYDGFDIIPQAISWCQNNITKKYPRFHFQHADIYNGAYHPTGKYKASEYRFPFPNESFDFVFLTSVFTHLLPQDLEHYFSEVTRVSRRGGRSFITYFLLDEESSKRMKDKKSLLNFEHDLGGCFTSRIETPEWAIAYEKRFIQNLYEKHHWQIVDPIHPGSWCGREHVRCGQDTIIGIRT